MTYQALARKWRPQTFTALVGQEAIVTALRNALGDGRIAQAYLFSGIRGVGKTTAARILAKALNCVGADGAGSAPVPDPCNECLACTETTRGGNLDVIEIDAATHSKVEQVRNLTESLKYGPARDRYKVVVLDEIHRLSKAAFDALLKIVEEPPRHLTFVFATTEIEMVPATVLSRCQEYHFRRVPADPMVAHLGRLCEAEEITAGGAALRLIARASEGSVRDAVALLDQLSTFGQGRLVDEDVLRLLGGIDTRILSTLLEAIFAGDGRRISTTLRAVEDSGSDPRRIFTQFLGFLRSALHLAQGLDPSQLDLPAEAAAELRETARAAGYEDLLRLLHLLLSSEAIVRRADAAGLALEVALLRAAELPKLVRIERLAGRVPAEAGSLTPRTAGRRNGGSTRRGGSTERGGAPPTRRSIDSTGGGLGPTSNERPESPLDGPSASGTGSGGRPLPTAGDRQPAGGARPRRATEGGISSPKSITRGKAGPSPPSTPPPRRAGGRRSTAQSAVETHPSVRAVLDVFGGRILDVRPKTT